MASQQVTAEWIRENAEALAAVINAQRRLVTPPASPSLSGPAPATDENGYVVMNPPHLKLRTGRTPSPPPEGRDEVDESIDQFLREEAWGPEFFERLASYDESSDSWDSNVASFDVDIEQLQGGGCYEPLFRRPPTPYTPNHSAASSEGEPSYSPCPEDANEEDTACVTEQVEINNQPERRTWYTMPEEDAPPQEWYDHPRTPQVVTAPLDWYDRPGEPRYALPPPPPSFDQGPTIPFPLRPIPQVPFEGTMPRTPYYYADLQQEIPPPIDEPVNECRGCTWCCWRTQLNSPEATNSVTFYNYESSV